MPETSIVIRTFNEEKNIGTLLDSLSKQTYRDYEIIIVDSESNDKTIEISKKYPVKIINIKRNDFTFGYALNVGCEAAQGKYIVFVSAHVLPATETWLYNLISPFKDNRVAMVYGRQKGDVGSKYSEQKDFWRLFSKTSINSKVPLYYANNANSAIRKSLWNEEKFDEYLFGLEDIDWARRVISKGFLAHYEPNAPIYHIHRETWSQVFNRYRREAIAAVRIGLQQPPQSRLELWWLILRVSADIIGSNDWSIARINEILRFRYYQWKGSNLGWKQGKNIDFKTNKDNIFNNEENFSVVIKDKKRAELKSTQIPEMKPGDVLIKVDYVGVCRTDIEVYEGTIGYYRDGIASYPIVPGHEFSGTIVRIGSNNRYQERYHIGQRVVSECILSRDPKERKEVGVINHDGAYSKYIVVPGGAIHPIPDGLDSKNAVLTEPLAVVLRAIKRIRNKIIHGTKIAIIGAGAIGHLCAKVLSLEGYEVTVFDKNKERLLVFNNSISTSGNIIDLDKFDIIFEATGSKQVLEQVIKKSKQNCAIMLLGFPYGEINYNFEDLVGNEKLFVGSVGADEEDFNSALLLLQKIDVHDFVKTILPLSEFKKAWQLYSSGKNIKILLQP